MRFDRVLGLSVVALAALSTCATAEPIRSLELQTRDTPCPSSYESRNGLNFTTYCDQNNPWNDATDPITTDTMEECMEHCSRFWGNGEGCFGIVWNTGNQCWMRNSTTSTQSLYPETGTYSALVPRDEVQGVSTDCPFDNLSIQTVRNVENFTIHCNQDINGYDLCFDEYAECLPSPFRAYWHADSLQECMEICADSHPLCQAVTWNPSQTIGFANCWTKTGWQNALRPAPGSQVTDIMHSAALTSIQPVNTTCPAEKSYDSKGKTFDINCGQMNTGTNITSIHRANITACVDACANSDNDCVGVVFDSTLAGGFQNCYLQNTTSVISNNANTTFALLSGTSLPTSSPTGTTPPSSSSKSSSKAWIAGPVIGGVVAIGLIAGGIFWWRRRRSAGPVSGTTTTGYKDAPGYGYSYAPTDPGELHGETVHGETAAEMEGAGRPVKYAHEPRSPQELPS